MSKKTAKERKEIKKNLEVARKKLALIEEDIEIVTKMYERKFSPELYQPGGNFEERMKYQRDEAFLAAARRHDQIQSEFELMKLREQRDYYANEVKRCVEELKERD